MPTKRLHTFTHQLMTAVAMNKMILILPLFCFFGKLLAITVDPYYRHSMVSPHAASEIFYTGSERQILAPAPVSEASVPVAAPAAPVAAVAPAASVAAVAPAPVAFAAPAAPVAAAPLAFPAPAAAVAPAAPSGFTAATAFAVPAAPVAAAAVPVAPVAPVVAKVAQFKLSYPQYAYGYSVQDFTTGDNKVAKEVREGGIVKGSYSVADPDGTKRTVNYYADPIHGFNAVVHKTQVLK